MAVLPASALAGLTGMGSGPARRVGVQSAQSGSGSGPAAAGTSAAILGALLGSATPVHGTWGSGRLLRTSLVSVLITNGGHVLIGAVTPQVLYSAAAQVK